MDGGAYGAGKASGHFDVIAFLKKPRVILRLVSLLFAIIVFGCITNQAWEGDTCRYNDDSNACGFGTVIGVLAFLGLLLLLAVDAMFDNISGVQHRKYAVVGDMGFSGTWTFFYFVNFCYLTDAWRKTDEKVAESSDYGNSGVEAAIAFSFFSIATFAGLTVLAVLRYSKGVSEQFTAGYEPDVLGVGPRPGQQAPYSSYPPPGGDQDNADPFRRAEPYQPAPFGGGPDQRQPPGDFQPVTY